MTIDWKRGLCAACLVTVATLTGCGGSGEPVAEVSVGTATVRLPYASAAELEVAWTPLAPFEEPIVFVHLWDRQGRLLRTFDHAYPGEWRVGEELAYDVALWQSALGPPLPPGRYDLAIGVTDGDERPALAVVGEEIDSGEYVIAEVEVPAPTGWVLGCGWPKAGSFRARRRTARSLAAAGCTSRGG